MKNGRKKLIGKIMMAIGIALMIGLGLVCRYTLKEATIYRSIQHSIQKMDIEMQQLMDKGLDHTELEKNETGLFVFMNDTLVLWNNNEVSPRLMKRKVNVGHDTICQLLAGDYFIKSYEKGAMKYYIFKALNTTYPIENQYFENRSTAIPVFINAKVDFQTEDSGQEITNAEGKTLTRCQIVEKPSIRKPFNYWYIPLLALIFIGLILVVEDKKKKTKGRSSHLEIGMAAIIVTSIAATYVYYRVESKRENENIMISAEKLLKKRDESFEKSYESFTEKIRTDTALREMLFSESNVLADVILGYSKELLFDETMKAYTTSLTVCMPNEEITIQPDDYVTDCENFFLEKLANNEQSNLGNGLYFIDYYTLDPNYLGKIRVVSQDSLQQKTLYFEFYKPIVPEGFGFPQMLQNTQYKSNGDFSVANFRNNILVYKYGHYIYPNFLNNLSIADHGFTYDAKYKHYAIKSNEADALIITARRKDFSEITAPFAVFFLGLALPYLLIMWLINPKLRKWRDRNLRQRLQTVILSTLGISFLAVGPVSVIYIQSVYNQKTVETQFETTRTVANELTYDIDVATLLRTTSRDTWTDILQHYADNFFTDLNLYNLNGRLIATTRPEIYEMHLQAPIMNAEAFQNMHRNKALYYTHQEHLGKGTYESSYIPINDNNGNTLAYLNTPYFSSTSDLHNEIKNFVLTYINIILILLSIALAFVLRMTRRLAQPLSLIQSKMRDIKIDRKNEPIEWKGDDEIGALVKQYNQLIAELEKSAAELKRTTTESAWRGVARQVAHEIKNSLTPMRLSVQLLQRKMDSGNATPEQIQRTTNTLIEQIDALSDIASSFSTYAKLPENHPAPLNLAELIQNVVNLYDNAENITFSYDYDPAADHTFNGDKTNLNSAVGNLIKNAVQAIGSKPDGRIDVALKTTETAFVVSVKDNGKGIKEKYKSQIFLPNFTTKTGGSGVGLSLTYNIVQAAGGTISFESREGEGALFEIVLPKT